MSISEMNNGFEVISVLNEAEQKIFMCKVGELLQDQGLRYLGCDSSSMSVEKAQDLLDSLMYTIQVACENGATKSDILDNKLSLLIYRGRDILEVKTENARRRFAYLLSSSKVIPNRSYFDALKNIDVFFNKYEWHYSAHAIPRKIDYPLLCPVSEKILGVSYIEEFLRRLQMENDFVACFDKRKVMDTYKGCSSDYIEEHKNLCEPILTNAVCLRMIAREGRNLTVTSSQLDELLWIVQGMNREYFRDLVKMAVYEICDEIGMNDREVIAYFDEALEGLSYRMYEAAKVGDLSHVFIVTDDCIQKN